ncbi:MAG: response regulator transcription factor [Blastochloris sp.]|nr:response regulator transcription factor [Blastochloris sp.]
MIIDEISVRDPLPDQDAPCPMRILVVEDEKRLAQLIRKGLRENGFVVDVLHNGDEALQAILSTPFDAVVLDVMLPGRDGLSILRQARDKGNRVPLIFLTARSGINECVEGLNLGADDYMTKPFSVDELAARIRALIRRGSGESLNLYKIEDLVLDTAKRTVCRGNRKIELTTREFSLLEYLVRSPGRVFTRTQICEHVWDYQFDPGTNLIDVYIQRLRRKIDDGESLQLIQTVRGIGYRMSGAA